MSHLTLPCRVAGLGVAVSITVAGCFDLPTAPHPTAPDASTPTIERLRLTDFGMRPWPLDRAPRRPRFHVAPEAAWGGDPEPVMLFEGRFDDALRSDLGRAPLTQRSEARRVALVVDRSGDKTTAVVSHPLAPATEYTFVIAGWASTSDGGALEEPIALSFIVAAGAEGGSVVQGSWPADGTAGVPPNLPLAAVWLDGEVMPTERGIRLEAGGVVVAATTGPVSCLTVGWPAGTCFTLEPLRLPPRASVAIVVDNSVRDRTDAPVGPVRFEIETAADFDETPPSFVALACALDEEPIDVGCLLRDDRSVTVRLQASEPARLFLEGPARADRTVAPRGAATLRLTGLEPGAPVDAVVRAIDLAGHVSSISLSTSTHGPLAPVGITEVRADPIGPEPAQEYVEVVNSGAVPLDLLGFRLADHPDREGDLITSSLRIPAGARALIVASGFDATHPDDVPVPDGVPLLRVDASLGSGGLTNRGEPLFLRDPEGRRVSAAPSRTVAAGGCLVRVSDDLRTGDEAAFEEGPCTPGRPAHTR
jgi:hypothetical protein